MDPKDLLIKGSIGLAGAGTIGFAGYQAINSKQETKEINNIQKRLEKEGYTLLTKGDAHFTTILSDYKTITGTKGNLKFYEFTGDKPNGNNKEPKDILWEHCQKAFNNEATDEVFNKARKWCVVPIKVSDILKKQGFTALNAAADDSSSKEDWNKKIQKYRKEQGIPEGFKNLTLKDTNETITETHRKTIKDKCNSIGDVLSHKTDFENNLDIFRDWCTDKE